MRHSRPTNRGSSSRSGEDKEYATRAQALRIRTESKCSVIRITVVFVWLILYRRFLVHTMFFWQLFEHLWLVFKTAYERGEPLSCFSQIGSPRYRNAAYQLPQAIGSSDHRF